MYIRTYNENNSPFADWWTPWQKLQGIREGYIFTDEDQVNPDGGVQTLVGTTGLYNMIDNGIYSGIYTDDYTFQAPTFIETFTLIVINNYAVAGMSNGQLKRTISQLKYAVDAITNQASVKQRTKTDGEDWTEWKDIAGGGGSQEVDITDAVKTYGLTVLAEQGYVKEGVNYIMNFRFDDLNGSESLGITRVSLDRKDKIATHLINKAAGSASDFLLSLKVIKGIYNHTLFEVTAYELDGSGSGKYYRFIMSYDLKEVKVSEDMTIL